MILLDIRFFSGGNLYVLHLFVKLNYLEPKQGSLYDTDPSVWVFVCITQIFRGHYITNREISIDLYCLIPRKWVGKNDPCQSHGSRHEPPPFFFKHGGLPFG